jgi:hypothetical protein
LESAFGVLYKRREKLWWSGTQKISKRQPNCYSYIIQYFTSPTQNLHIINTKLPHVKLTFLEPCSVQILNNLESGLSEFGILHNFAS